MALRLNLHHEIQKQRALNRRDPLKLSMFGLGAIAACFAGYYAVQLGVSHSLTSDLATIQGEVRAMEERLKGITEDQVRLRANIERVPKDSEVYKRYLAKFDTQETQIEKLQKEIKASQDTEFAQRKAFEDYLAKLDVE